MFRKILKWTGIAILFIIVILSITVASRQHLTYDAPYPNIEATADTNIILRGKELVFGPAHCADCHAPGANPEDLANGIDVPLTGGFAFHLPIGAIYTRNLTPDRQTGIGRYSDPEIARLLRYGVRPDGTAILDFMPFHNTSDEDLTAIISYLRAQAPVYKKVPDHQLNLLGKVVTAFMIKPVGPSGEVLKTVKRDTSIAYGKYLANSVANCVGCHTKRDMMTGAFTGDKFAGGMGFQSPTDPDKVTYLTPNLTPDPATGRITHWSQQQFISRFRMGKLIRYSEMPWSSFSRMSDNDLTAIYKYLKSLPPVKHEFPAIAMEEK